MEVKPGYKQTDVGVIPEEWDVETIGELIERQTIVGHLDGNHGELYPRSHEFKPYGVPYIGANDFDEGDVTFERCKFLSAERASKFRKGVAKDGDVLFAHNATVGPVALLRTSLPFVILSTTATYFRCNPEKLNNAYLKGALQSSHFVKQYQAVMAQSTRFQVPITAQRKLSLVIPPLPEQRAIATALSDVDALLGALDRLIAKKRDVKQAAMQQLLTGQTRLPGLHGEWEVTSLNQVVTRTTGFWGATNRDDRHTRHAAIIRAGDISPRGELTDTASRFLSDAEFAKAQCRLDDLVITTSGNGLGKVWWCDGRADIAASNFVRVMRPSKAKANGKFLSYVLRSGEALRQLQEHTATSAYPNLRLTFFSATWIPLPTVPEQTAIAAVLTEMDAELAMLEQRQAKTRALKQGMMQELLTGRTRLI